MTFTESWLEGPQRTQFYTRLYKPQTKPVAALVFIHGFAEHIGRYTPFHTELMERGILIFTFDQRGFGKTAMDKKNKSPSSSYGKTSWDDQLADIVWAIEHVTKEQPSLSVFLAGHSMGGGEVLGFATQNTDSPHLEKLPLLSGIVAMSPLIHLAKPAAKPMRVIGSLLSKIMPNVLFPTQLDPKAISRDPKVVEDYIKDPMVRAQGSLRGLDDMLTHGELLLSTKYVDWFQDMPVLFLQGTADGVTSYPATRAFHSKLEARYKKIVPFEDAFHELHNEIDGIPVKVADEIVGFIREFQQR
ncbi:Alpha/Beta hydrolase protein [Amanita rubescens]|nr:Alpha/Beta hydrolase protein [Amanita rubescens]